MSPTNRNTTDEKPTKPATADAPRVTMADPPARPDDDVAEAQICQNERDMNDQLTDDIEPIPYDLSAAASSLMGSINDEHLMGRLQSIIPSSLAAPNNQSDHGQNASTMNHQQHMAAATQHGADHGAGTNTRNQRILPDALARILSAVNVSQQQQQQIGQTSMHRIISDASSLVGPSSINGELASFPTHAIPASVSVAALGQGYHCLSAMSTQNVAIASEIVKQEESNYQASMAKRTNDLDEKSAQHRQNTAQIQQVEVSLQNALDHQGREHKVAEEQEKANDEQVKTQLTKYQDALLQKNMDTAHASEQDKADTELVAQKELAYEEALLQQEEAMAQVQQAHSELRDSLTQQRTNQQESMTKHHSNNTTAQQEKSKYYDVVARQNTDQERTFTQDQANNEQVKKHKSAYQDALVHLDSNQRDAYVQHRANSEIVQQNLTTMDTALVDYNTVVLQRRALANQAAAINQNAAPLQLTPNFQAGVSADNSVPVVDNAAHYLQLQARIFLQLAQQQQQQQQLTTTTANPPSDMSSSAATTAATAATTTAAAATTANANGSKKRKSPP